MASKDRPPRGYRLVRRGRVRVRVGDRVLAKGLWFRVLNVGSERNEVVDFDAVSRRIGRK